MAEAMSVVTAQQFVLPPELAVEVASPSTAAYDANRKTAVYTGFGIPSYWIFVPDPSPGSEGSSSGACAGSGRLILAGNSSRRGRRLRGLRAAVGGTAYP